MSKETEKLLKEDVSINGDCELCKEVDYDVGQKTDYGVVIYKNGNKKNGWFATLSPKTGGNPKLDFTIQLMPFAHLTHFSQISNYDGMAVNYGICFSKVCQVMTIIMMEDENLKATSEKRNDAASIATYGKSTTWKEKKEHLHIKVFPFRDNVGQPYTVDSTFGKKEIFKEKDEEFVKMQPVKKIMIDNQRFQNLTEKLISLLK
jgi:hypothetical protein